MTKKESRNTDEHRSIFGNRESGSTRAGGRAKWSGADRATITNLIDAVTSRGGAIRFGYTRDGGAYAIGLYYGSESTTEYCRPGEDINIFLEGWVEFYLGLPDTDGKSPAQ